MGDLVNTEGLTLEDKKNIWKGLISKVMSRDPAVTDKPVISICPQCGASNSVSREENVPIVVECDNKISTKTIEGTVFLCEECDFEGYTTDTMCKVMIARDGRDYLDVIRNEDGELIKRVLN